MTTTLTITFLSILLLIASFSYYRAKCRIADLTNENNVMRNDIKCHIEANCSPDVLYHVQRADPMPGTPLKYKKYSGYWGVCRRIIVNGRMYTTTIKIFTDPDDSFNRREAEELRDMLNSKQPMI